MLHKRYSFPFILSLLVLVDVCNAVFSEPIQEDYYRTCPLPECNHCPSYEELQAPGIGFALETSYGAAVVRLRDGSYQHIALIEGDESYTALLRRYAIGPVNRTPDNFDTNWGKWQYAKDRAQRMLNKSLGRPATPETAILANMVSTLGNAAQVWLGSNATISAAVLSSPDRIRLTDEEIGDVCDYLNLKNLMAIPDNLEDLYATSAAYAGYGKGLCSNYTDAYACEHEEWYFHHERVLHVDFSRESLSSTIKSLRSARDGSVDDMFVDPDLGFAREEIRIATAPDEFYWNMVTRRIRNFVASYKPQVTQIILTGTSVMEPRFRAALKDALHDLGGNEEMSRGNIADQAFGLGDDIFQYATARGAAEFAKRRQEGPVRCAWTEECRQRREGHRAERPRMFDGKTDL